MTHRIRMEVSADVEVTDEIKQGLKEQYGWSDAQISDDEKVARAIMYASFNPTVSSWEVANAISDDMFDGVGNMKGLIKNVEVDDDPF
ncbi:hypothetical protein BSK59_15995 [Paenibacillus odorifer]|uniref:hypothetical protein n=1 Tax=Paenibacillus odorifer TaxID=189426 RepID=UPI00096EE075|nr:hypothetical protein [Paenibacillus odorifer]OME54082.1 hypothetical protein BSK59_15995 [Paenibacillus odorifer]